MQTMFNDLLYIIKLSFQEKIFRKIFRMQILDNLFLFDLISVSTVGRSETTRPLQLRKKMHARLLCFPAPPEVIYRILNVLAAKMGVQPLLKKKQ